MPEPAAPPPAMVLIRPQLGENIGAAARAMLNFGLTDLRLVAPRDGWPNPRAEAMAAGAAAVLEGARVFDTLAGAVADCGLVLATTARPRDMAVTVLSPEAAMAEAHALRARGRRTALLFGPERAGLENDDIALANAVVTVPVNPDFPSLNLAQCVLLMSYEWQRLSIGAHGPDRPAMPRADHGEVERLARHFEERLDASGFFFPPAKAPHMRRTLRNLWSRMPLTHADIQVLHGALRQLVRGRDPSA